MDIFIIHLLIKYALIISSNINNVNIMILEKINKKVILAMKYLSILYLSMLLIFINTTLHTIKVKIVILFSKTTLKLISLIPSLNIYVIAMEHSKDIAAIFTKDKNIFSFFVVSILIHKLK